MTPLCFAESLEQYGDSIALVLENEREISYSELAARVDLFCERIRGEKQLVFILSGANLPSIVAYLAALRADQVAVLINGELDSAAIESLVQHYQPEWIFEPLIKGRAYEHEEGGYGLRRSHTICGKMIHSELALLLSTSGTTGSPKMVKLTKQNLSANVASIIEFLSIDRDERAILSLPMHYSYGLSVLNTHLAAGASIVLTEKSMMSREFWDIFTKKKVTSLAGVPYHYEMLLRLKLFAMDLPHLRILTQAGGRLSPKYVQKFSDYANEKNLRFFVMYGQTEATARISYIPAEEIAENPGSIGRAIPGGKLYLQSGAGVLIEGDGQEGELVYEGANVMMGYAGCRHDLSSGDELWGRLLTGDIARRESNGFFTITGRKKRFVKLFGNRVNLDEVEQLLERNGFDALCGGEDNGMMIVLTDILKLADAKKCVTTHLGVHHSAIHTAAVDRFCRTASGKIDYGKTFSSCE